jgi:hypothetical protein
LDRQPARVRAAADLIDELAGDQDVGSSVVSPFAATVITGTRHQIAITEHP